MEFLLLLILFALAFNFLFGNKQGGVRIGGVFGLLSKVLLRMVQFVGKFGGKAFDELVFLSKDKGDHKDSFASPSEKNGVINSGNHGLVIEQDRRLSELDSFKHLAMIAPAGGGKTTKFIIPNILSLTSSAVITDPSGELYDRTSGYLASQGFKIKVLNLEKPNQSLKYNPLYRAVDPADAKRVADLLIEASLRKEDKREPFWIDGAKGLLNVLIRCLKNEPQKYQNLHNLRHLLNNFGTDGTSLDPFFIRNADGDTVNELKGLLNRTESILMGQVSTASVALDKVANQAISLVTARETLHFESLREEKTAIYVIYPTQRVSDYRFLLNLLYTQIFDFAMQGPVSGKPYLPIYFLLDEFGNLGTIPDFSSLITTLRKFKCSCSLILQNYTQLEENYSKSGARTIFYGGCNSKLFLPAMDPDLCKEVSEILGKRTVRYKDRNKAWVEKERALLTPSEVRGLKRERAIFLYHNEKPMILSLKPADKDASYTHMLSHPPFPLPAETPRPPLNVTF